MSLFLFIKTEFNFILGSPLLGGNLTVPVESKSVTSGLKLSVHWSRMPPNSSLLTRWSSGPRGASSPHQIPGATCGGIGFQKARLLSSLRECATWVPAYLQLARACGLARPPEHTRLPCWCLPDPPQGRCALSQILPAPQPSGPRLVPPAPSLGPAWTFPAAGTTAPPPPPSRTRPGWAPWRSPHPQAPPGQ